MMLDRVQLKLEAKAITKNAAVSAYLFTLLYLAIGLVIYFGYGYRHARLGAGELEVAAQE